ncbi:hypothetical protein F4780DRAFT_576262 [Xylariomycetidae sp. FL0641]|nr:hypothetical protein F4780DRAFT_576262 [Xylariomycetidae sp. FL0641]
MQALYLTHPSPQPTSASPAQSSPQSSPPVQTPIEFFFFPQPTNPTTTCEQYISSSHPDHRISSTGRSLKAFSHPSTLPTSITTSSTDLKQPRQPDLPAAANLPPPPALPLSHPIHHHISIHCSTAARSSFTVSGADTCLACAHFPSRSQKNRWLSLPSYTSSTAFLCLQTRSIATSSPAPQIYRPQPLHSERHDFVNRPISPITHSPWTSLLPAAVPASAAAKPPIRPATVPREDLRSATLVAMRDTLAATAPRAPSPT